ncbi:MAG: hypothetical protein J2P58_04410 [Acidimicrobiaceae bacterium]|nr:hypothetical protein [Acidimicrobiaceae bacterium]MBO0747472.1 hypothetical protein [Acidimicrobiaceae bacterium]
MRGDAPLSRRHLGAAGRGRITCESIADLLPGLAMGETDVSVRVREHVAVCLRCQAEMARYRRLRRNLLALREQRVEAVPMLASQILERLDDANAWDRSSRTALQVACVGGISVATVAGAGMLVWFTKRRLALAS